MNARQPYVTKLFVLFIALNVARSSLYSLISLSNKIFFYRASSF